MRSVRALAVIGQWMACAAVGTALAACGGGESGAGDGGPRAGSPGAAQPPVGASVRDCRSRAEGGTIEIDPGRDVVIGPVAFYGQGYSTQPDSDYTMPARRVRQLLDGPGGRELPRRERRFLEGALREGRPLYPGVKVLAIVRAGASATVAIPPAERRNISLLYGRPGSRHSYLFEVKDGDAAQTFRACRGFLPAAAARRECGWKPYKACLGSNTQFNGGFVVAGPRCATLEVWPRGASRPVRGRIGFGVRC